MAEDGSGIGPLVLIVDDDEPMHRIYGRILRRAGYRVESANNGAAAVTAALELRPDIVLMNLHMPFVDGWEATRRIRSADGRQPAIVATSGRDLDSRMPDLLLAGFDAMLVKPCDPDEVKQLLAALLFSRSSGADV